MARYLAECTETLSEISEVFFSPNCLCLEYGDEGLLAVSEYMAYFLGGGAQLLGHNMRMFALRRSSTFFLCVLISTVGGRTKL